MGHSLLGDMPKGKFNSLAAKSSGDAYFELDLKYLPSLATDVKLSTQTHLPSAHDTGLGINK